MSDSPKVKVAFVLAFVNLIALLFVMYAHNREMRRFQQEIFSLQEDVLSLQERMVKLQKASHGVVERSTVDNLPHRSNESNEGGGGR